jgi:hypothetical protein
MILASGADDYDGGGDVVGDVKVMMAAMQRVRMDMSCLTVFIGVHVQARHREQRGRRDRSAPEQQERDPPPPLPRPLRLCPKLRVGRRVVRAAG